MTTTMKCFVAGTLVLTANGLIAIEAIKTGDKVYAADADTLEVSLQTVLETYIRETSKLVHITVNGEEIISTYDHPYYVKGKGFVSAEALWIGAELVDNNGQVLRVEQIYREILDNERVKVYNFKVDEWHTYYVGNSGVLVHNASEAYNGVPVPKRTTASNGLDYESNTKHTPGQPGNRPDAGIEPKNSLDLFGESTPSTKNPKQRYTYEKSTDTLHRFSQTDTNGNLWHWSGSTNQGKNSLTGSQVPNDIKNLFNLRKKGW